MPGGNGMPDGVHGGTGLVTPTKNAWFSALESQGLTVYSARDAAVVVGWLDTGNYALNWAISGRFGRGYPLGHTVEIFGDPSTGKSYLIARAVARAQEAGGVTLLDDVEGAYNVDWIETLGVDAGKLAYAHSRTVKDHLVLSGHFLKAYKALLDKGKIKGPGLLAVDSLALLSTEHELKVRLDKRDMTKAGELRGFFRIMMGDLYALPVVHISTNHIIAKIGDLWNPRTTPGGGGPKYQASVRIDLRSASKIKTEDTNEVVGVLCRVVVDKNRIAPPWKEVRLTIPFYQPISAASGLIPVLLDLGILTVAGQFLQYEGRKLGLRVYKDRKKVLRQDEEAERLLDMVPEILEAADTWLETHTPTIISSEGHHADDEEAEEGDE